MTVWQMAIVCSTDGQNDGSCTHQFFIFFVFFCFSGEIEFKGLVGEIGRPGLAGLKGPKGEALTSVSMADCLFLHSQPKSLVRIS